MQILKGNAFKKKTGQFGDFELRADKGWKISESFLDYDAYLLTCALQRQAPLISLDKRLIQAAKLLNITILEIKQ